MRTRQPTVSAARFAPRKHFRPTAPYAVAWRNRSYARGTTRAFSGIGSPRVPSATAHFHCRADAGVPFAHSSEHAVGGCHVTLALRADIHGAATPAYRAFEVLHRLGDPELSYVERIDDSHANGERAWIEMGAPQEPHPTDVAALESASALAKEVVGFDTRRGVLELTVSTPPQGAALPTLELA
jgi:hypothetical protein